MEGILTQQTVSQALAKFTYDFSYADLTKDAIEKGKDLILDNIGTAYGGYDLEGTRIAVALVRDYVRRGGDSTIIGHAFKANAAESAFANSAMIHSISQDDFHQASLTHPGAVIIPVCISVGEQENATGADVLLSMVIGYEVLGKLGKAVSFPIADRGFRTTSVLCNVGATASASKLLRLNEVETSNALGLAANFSSGLSEYGNAGTTEWQFHAAIASRNSVIAALLAKKGAEAASTTFEGGAGFFKAFAGKSIEINQIAASLGKNPEILEVFSKPYPVCGFNQTAVDIALAVANKHNINPENVNSIKMTVSQTTKYFPGIDFHGPFSTLSQGTMSMPLTVAVAFLHKRFSLDISLKKFNSPELLEFAKKIELEEDKSRSITSAKIDVAMKGGKHFAYEKQNVRSSPKTAIVDKFEKYASRVIGSMRTKAAIEEANRLEVLDNIKELTKLFTPA